MRTILVFRFYIENDNDVWQFGFLLHEKENCDIEKTIKDEVTKLYGDGIALHHIVVDEVPLNTALLNNEAYLNRKVYLDDGTLWNENDYNVNIDVENTFNGRDESTLHFNVGDRVKILIGDTLSEATVYGLPPKPGEFKDGMLDEFDDSYTVITGEYDWKDRELSDEEYMERHEHIMTCNVFPINKN